MLYFMMRFERETSTLHMINGAWPWELWIYLAQRNNATGVPPPLENFTHRKVLRRGKTLPLVQQVACPPLRPEQVRSYLLAITRDLQDARCKMAMHSMQEVLDAARKTVAEAVNYRKDAKLRASARQTRNWRNLQT